MKDYTSVIANHNPRAQARGSAAVIANHNPRGLAHGSATGPVCSKLVQTTLDLELADLNDLHGKQLINKLVDKVSQMSDAEINEWYDFLMSGGDAGIQVRRAAREAAEQYCTLGRAVPDHVLDALNAALDEGIEPSAKAVKQPSSFHVTYLSHLQKCDSEVEHHFFKHFGGLLRLKLRTRRLPSTTIDDVIQETFVRVLVSVRRDAIRKPERLGSYVNSVCNNVLHETYRFNIRNQQHPNMDSIAPADEKKDLESRVLSCERAVKVRKVLNRLPERDKKVLAALFCEERSKDELCKELGVNKKYLRVLLFRAKVSFRNQYEPNASGDQISEHDQLDPVMPSVQ